MKFLKKILMSLSLDLCQSQVMWQRESTEARLAAWQFTWQTDMYFGQMTQCADLRIKGPFLSQGKLPICVTTYKSRCPALRTNVCGSHDKGVLAVFNRFGENHKILEHANGSLLAWLC
jgi:hypothetical protein